MKRGLGWERFQARKTPEENISESPVKKKINANASRKLSGGRGHQEERGDVGRETEV